MMGLTFNKQAAAHFLDCLANGKSIDHAGGWTANDMITLAGACFYAVKSQGTTQDKLSTLLGAEPVERHLEHQEALETDLVADIHATVEFAAQLTWMIHVNAYDERYAPEIELIMQGDTRSIQPIKGFKDVG